MSTVKRSTSKQYRIEAPAGLDLEKRQFAELYYLMSLNRRLEERLSVLYRQNKVVGGLYSSLGQEATSVGSAYALEEGDFLGPMIRNLGSYLARGITAKDFVAQYLARECSPTRGKDGTQHFGDLKLGLVACISMLGALVPVMMGVAMAMKHRGQKNVALTYCGDGATSTTDFHEGLNFAAVQRVPLILIAEHNHYAYATPVSMQFSVENIADRAPAYGIHGEIVDGNNVLAVYDATRRARHRCIEGNGPVLVEAKTFRRRGHAEHDPADYVPKRLREKWERKDPLDAYSRFVLDETIMTRTELDEVDERITQELEDAVQEVLDSPFPDTGGADQGVYFAAREDGGSYA